MSGPGSDDADQAWRPPARPAGPPRVPPAGPAEPTSYDAGVGEQEPNAPSGPPVLPDRETLAGYDRFVEIGRGGDSVVYRAHDLVIGRDVAVKVLTVDDPERAERFAREIAITAELGRQHPHIVNVLAIGTTSAGRPAIVMDLYDRGSVADQLATHGPLPVEEVVALGTVLADALAFAHSQGVLHRDVKPQNVLLLPTSWVLADFGIARLAASEHTASVETFTYRHASPQVLDGYGPAEADDIWSLGSTLFTLVDGQPPFTSEDPDDDSALAYLRRARTEPHRRLRVPGTEALAAVIDRCLAKDVADRWPSAAALRDALAALRVRAWEPGGTTADPVARLDATGGSSSRPPSAHPAAGRAVGPAAPLPQAQPATGPGPILDATAVRPTEPASSRGAVEPAPIQPAPIEPVELPPATPDPLAFSVLAHAAAEPVADIDATGVRPAEPVRPTDLSPRESRTDDEQPDPHRGRRRLIVGLAVLALLVGLGLGIVGKAMRTDEPVAAPGLGGTPSPSLGGSGVLPSASESPVQSGDPQVDGPNPDLAFSITKLEANGIALKLAWEEATDGVGTYTIYQTVPKGGDVQEVVGTPRGDGVDEAQIPFAVTAGRRYCFVMSVVMPDGDLGVSPPLCTTAKTT